MHTQGEMDQFIQVDQKFNPFFFSGKKKNGFLSAGNNQMPHKSCSMKTSSGRENSIENVGKELRGQKDECSHFLPVHALNRLGQRPARLVFSLRPTGSIDDQNGESGPPSRPVRPTSRLPLHTKITDS